MSGKGVKRVLRRIGADRCGALQRGGKAFANFPGPIICPRMTSPLAFLMYEELLPGSQLPNKLQDLGYRVQTLNGGSDWVELVQQEKPIVAIMELHVKHTDACAIIGELKRNPDTEHLPVLAYTQPEKSELQAAARDAGAALIASNAGMLDQLPALLEHVLEVE